MRVFLALFIPLFSAFSASSLTEEEKVERLIRFIGEQKATYIRNGTEHTPKEAMDHIRSKFNRARRMFWFFGPSKKIGAREFIEKIASHSSTTGRPYQMKYKNGKVAEDLGPLLTRELAKIE